MLLGHFKSVHSGKCSYCIKRVFSQFAKSHELFSYTSTRLHSLGHNLSTKLTAQQHEEKASNRGYKEEDKNDDDPPRKKKPRSTVSKEFEDYFMQNPSLARIRRFMPEKLMRRRRKTDDSLYLVDQDIAGQIVECVKSFILDNNCFVLEGNPGLGLLSERLVQAGVKRLHLFENCSSFFNSLEDLQKKYPNRISITYADIFAIWKYAYQDQMDHGNRLETLFSPFPKQDWSQESSLKIIGAVRSTFFVKHLILSIVFQNSIMAYCRPEFYLVLPPSLHEVLTSSRDSGYGNYRGITVLFQLFFDYELLDRLPRQAFLPWSFKPSSGRKAGKILELQMLDQEFLYLMKIIPKKDVYQNVVAPDKMPLFWFFVRQNLMSRSNKVITKLESWIPNCGSRLILEGLNVFTEFGDLNPQEILRLFRVFVSWPEFKHCSFASSLEVALMKMEESADDSVDKSEDLEEMPAKDEELE